MFYHLKFAGTSAQGKAPEAPAEGLRLLRFNPEPAELGKLVFPLKITHCDLKSKQLSRVAMSACDRSSMFVSTM